MFGIGWSELVVVFIVALLIFGPRRLPEIGKSIGKALRMFKEASREMRDSFADVQAEFEREYREAQQTQQEVRRALLENRYEKEVTEAELVEPTPKETPSDGSCEESPKRPTVTP